MVWSRSPTHRDESAEPAARTLRTRLRRAIRGGADPDVLGTAQRLGVAIATHDVVMARSAAAAALLDQALQQAEAAGLLGFFNREYRRRRREAAAAGKSFVSYGNARRRLQHVVARAIADRGAIAPSMVAQVFESG